MAYLYNHLIEFNGNLSADKCEGILQQIAEKYGLCYDKVTEYYDTEDREYYIVVHIYADDEKLAMVKEILDKTGFEDLYDIYHKISK